MVLIFTIAGVGLVIYALLNFLTGLGRAKDTTEGKIDLKTAAIAIFGGFLLLLALVVFFLQSLAAVGVGSQAADPYSFNWVSNLFKDMMTGGLPQLR